MSVECGTSGLRKNQLNQIFVEVRARHREAISAENKPSHRRLNHWSKVHGARFPYQTSQTE